MNDPEEIIKKLKMIPHPEGGYFVESFRDKEKNVSLIYYLLKKNQRSHWHRLKKNEILHFYNGSPMSVHLSQDGKISSTVVLGSDINNNENIHTIVKAGTWFSMESKGRYSLIGCTVAPAFNYTDFELAPKNWEPGK